MSNHKYWFQFLKQRGYYYGGTPSKIQTAKDVYSLIYDEEKEFNKGTADKFLREQKKKRHSNEDELKEKLKGSYCYFIGNRKRKVVKIGRTTNIYTRLKSIQTGYPYNLKILGYIETKRPKKTEKKMHQYYRRYNLRGEWFKLSDRIELFLDELDNEVAFVF